MMIAEFSFFFVHPKVAPVKEKEGGGGGQMNKN